MTSKSFKFFLENLPDTIIEQIYDNIANDMPMEAKYQFDMGDGNVNYDVALANERNKLQF